MALALADSLTTVGWDLNDQARRFVQWWQTGEYSVNGRCFDIGITTRYALSRFAQTGDARLSGDSSERASGNGSIMRLAPVAMRFVHRFPNNLAELSRFAAESSLTTHASPQCLSACRYLTLILCGLMHGIDRDEVFEPNWIPLKHLREIEPLHPEVDEVSRGSFRDRHPPDIKGSGYVVRSLEAALWAFHRAGDFGEAVLRAVNLGDDADTTGAVCGQLAGACWGEPGIPEDWRTGLARRELIDRQLLRFPLLPFYETTDFWVEDAPGTPFSFRWGSLSPQLDHLLAEAGVDEWVYVTACNPGSDQWSDAQNAVRMRDLEATLRQFPCVVYHGRGIGADCQWPPEPSFLALGLSEQQGLAIGRAYGQAAIVVGRRGETCKFAWPT
jgi:ADP-ribosylglycohydrolase